MKAVFIDEFAEKGDESYDFIKSIEKHVEFVWIVPNAFSFGKSVLIELKERFRFFELSTNFRNSREIVGTIKMLAEGRAFDGHITMPLGNFPRGYTPIEVHSLKYGVIAARRRTKGGILVIDNTERNYYRFLNKMNEKWKVCKGRYREKFTEDENPYKFLKEGNILIVDQITCVGFEWPTVIVLFDSIIISCLFTDPCNSMMRCTTNLIVIRVRPDDLDLSSIMDEYI